MIDPSKEIDRFEVPALIWWWTLVVRELFPGLGDIGFLARLGCVGLFLPGSSKYSKNEKKSLSKGHGQHQILRAHLVFFFSQH